MPIVELKCRVANCANQVSHTKLVALVAFDYCDQHAKELMRCESNNAHISGDCVWCDAVNGEDCRK